jgi:YVTN family beta-propeller protein
MMDYMRIGGIPGCPATLQNPRKPEIQAALQELVAARSQRSRISVAAGTPAIAFIHGGKPLDPRRKGPGSALKADMMADGVFLIDGDAFSEIGFIATGIGAHGLYPSRDGTELYVSNRGSHDVHGLSHGPGSVSIIDFARRAVKVTWFIPGGGSPDMGNVSADGKVLWLSGRFDDVVYAIDTATGQVKTIPVGREPHGLTVWPQPGRYSLGHTGNMR